MKWTLIAWLIPTLLACRTEQNSESFYFTGMYYLANDTVWITDCATGIPLQAVPGDAYEATLERYKSLNPNPEEQVFFEFKGSLGPIPADWPSTPRQVTIRELIGFDRTVACNPEFLLPGTYEAKNAEGRYLLRLKPDYTYTESHFAPNDEIIASGIWVRTGDLQLELIQDQPNEDTTAFEIIPTQHTLVRNSGEGSLVYTKVYL